MSFLRKQESRKKQLDSRFRGNAIQGRESPAVPKAPPGEGAAGSLPAHLESQVPWRDTPTKVGIQKKVPFLLPWTRLPPRSTGGGTKQPGFLLGQE